MEGFLPFGTGRHSCLGQSLAMAELRLIIAKLIFNFDMHLSHTADCWDWGDQSTYIFWQKRPLEVRLSNIF